MPLLWLYQCTSEMAELSPNYQSTSRESFSLRLKSYLILIFPKSFQCSRHYWPLHWPLQFTPTSCVASLHNGYRAGIGANRGNSHANTANNAIVVQVGGWGASSGTHWGRRLETPTPPSKIAAIISSHSHNHRHNPRDRELRSDCALGESTPSRLFSSSVGQRLSPTGNLISS